MEVLDVALTVQGEGGDWYVIERAEHDGRVWLEPIGPNASALMCSSRIGNADIEGTYAEMVEIARAIKSGGCASFKRCRAETTPEGVLLCSPRNSLKATLVALPRALALADLILALPAPVADEMKGA